MIDHNDSSKFKAESSKENIKYLKPQSSKLKAQRKNNELKVQSSKLKAKKKI
jgi:hypothetical protein